MQIILFVLLGVNLAWAGLSGRESCERDLLAQLETADFQEKILSLNPENQDIRFAVEKLLRDRDPAEQLVINEELAQRHLQREMSFQVKNEQTGNYDRFVAVSVNGSVAPIREADFQRLVSSTGPVMRSLRALLQKIYSQKELTIENLGLQGVPHEEAEQALRVIRDSMYLEPQLIDAKMADYPFLAVGALDGAVVDPVTPQPQFFEMNLGTPSGISNNVQLLEDLSDVDPKLFRVIHPYLEMDSTFEAMRRALQDNAKAWTRADGISVIVSPGIFNGAHPDVATIARATGLPLVKSSDLYEDQKGNVRLRTGDSKRDPRVTGIYGRMEESFFLQSDRDQIPLISPNYKDNVTLGQRLGVSLRNGAIYDFEYDQQGQVTGVKRDSQGRPKLVEVWDSIGVDPARPEAEPGSFARAIRERRLYYSGLGGRVVDDKRLFRIVTNYLVADPQTENLARPIRGLSPADFSLFYAHPERFVVKEPDNSGGTGIHFPRAMESGEVARLIEKVKRSPADYEIQYVSTIATLPQATRLPSGAVENRSVPIDLRIFVMMDSHGEVTAGDNSLLLRTGARGGLYTNTSRGGGYGIAVVLQDEPTRNYRRTRAKWSRGMPEAMKIAKSRGPQLVHTLNNLKDLVIRLLEDPSEFNSSESRDNRDLALQVSFELRDLMDLIEANQMQLAPALRAYAQGDSRDSGVLVRQILRFIFDGRQSAFGYMDEYRDFMNREWRALDQIWRSPILANLRSMRAPTHIRPLPQIEVTYRYRNSNHQEQDQKVEIGEYVTVDNPEVQAVIDEIKERGGQVRLLKRRRYTEGHEDQALWLEEPPYFWLNLNPESPSYLIPVIGIDLNRPAALPSLHHEREHFRLWRDLYDQYRLAGENHEMASRHALETAYTAEMEVEGERRAVAAEMAAERDFRGHLFNSESGRRPSEFYEYGYVNRLAYPEFEGVRKHILKHKFEQTPIDEPLMKGYMRSMVRLAIETHARAIEHWENYERTTGLKSKELFKLRSQSVLDQLAYPFGNERLNQDETWPEFKALLHSVCSEMGLSEEQCGA